MQRREFGALAALAGILVISIGWWAAALWPLPAATPEWVIRARAACFGSTPSGLPNSGGWILLLGAPPTMVTALALMSGGALRAALGGLAARAAGRWALGATLALLLALSGAAGVRVLEASGRTGTAPAEPYRGLLERVDRPAPPLALGDQHGDTVRLERLRGRVVLLTFAYAKCETVCPLIVRDALQAQRELRHLAPVVLVVTLDPWRDTPARLPHIAAAWELGTDAHVLSGRVGEVEAALDAWGVSRSRDPRTGEIFHPSLVHLIDRDGTHASTVHGTAERIVEAAGNL